MNDNLISMYIDNELGLDEKIVFVETIHQDEDFKDDAVTLLQQEKLIRSEVVDHLPALDLKEAQKRLASEAVPAVCCCRCSRIGCRRNLCFSLSLPRQDHLLRPYRFVIYQPDAQHVELAGSFSGWKRIPLELAGQSGYWETTLELPEGEHRFSYFIEGGRRLADPTIAVREIDDFGGENSILKVKS